MTSAEAEPPAVRPAGDVWSHEMGTRRFEPGSGAYPASQPAPGSTAWEPSIVTRAFEQTMPPPSPVRRFDASKSPSAFVTDALSDLTAEDAARPQVPPRRDPGSPSTPPPGFSGS